jgi:hypothetical protein
MSENGEIENEKSSAASLLQQLYAMLVEIDVSKEGVGGAKNFFEAKVSSFRLGNFIHKSILFRLLLSKKAINFNVKFVKNKNKDVELKKIKLVEKLHFKIVLLIFKPAKSFINTLDPVIHFSQTYSRIFLIQKLIHS